MAGASQVALVVKNPPTNAGDVRDAGSVPASGRSTGEGLGYPLQYSWASLVAQLVKKHLQCGRLGFDPWIGKIPWRRAWESTPVFLFKESHGPEEPSRIRSIGSQTVRLN